ncbi:ATP-binding protein [Devosia sp.]|uniref:sensor histidine kinase n=1 Tax=Devosia sp. TaxID=1871048 RepID=UPI001AD08EB3|nr:ATP-binding protein [Devosia sp.]MBN9309618.1 sensor histidine kinase N-terminal domain-containing protein [Devosia sp.]
MNTGSITRRLVLALTAGAALLWLLGALFAILVVRNELQQTLDSGLRETAERILPLAVDSLGDDHDGDLDQPLEYHLELPEERHAEFVVYQVRELSGRVVMRSHDAPREGFSAALAQGFSNDAPWRIYTTQEPKTGLFIQVAEAAARREAALWGSILAMLLPLALLVPLGALGIHFAVRSGLAPLREVGKEVARRDVGNLAPLDISRTPTELRPMTAAIDDLLQRLRAAFEAERTLAANSAHELRTPIAGSLAQTQRLVDELSGHPAQPRARRVEETLHRLSALAAKLLALSRAESGTARVATAIDLLPALRLIVDETGGPRAHHDQVILDLSHGYPVSAPIDVDAFGIVMRNLIENALLHGKAGTPVVVAVPRPGVVEVSNGGPVVSADKLAELTRRFARGDTEAAGSGLGLTIVETIMHQVGGRLELLSPGTDREDGFTARLVFAG